MTMSRTVRVRYAPSPTGMQHIGSIRTALFNYLYARKHGGSFVLRFDDTDAMRSSAAFEDQICDELRWLGLRWDEGADIGGDLGPYRQSERSELYREAMQQLIGRGHVYPCYCSAEELAHNRRQALARGIPPRYSGRCRDLEQRETLRRQGRSPLFRFAVPNHGEIGFDDIVRHQVCYDSETIGDYAVYRAEDENLGGGRALYNLAAVVDDHAMQITHVLRGEEHRPDTPRQLLLYRALGHNPPRFGHLALITSQDGQKLSKRMGDVSVAEYMQKGYLPEAIIAYAATLGWAPGGNAERLALDELVERFDPGRLSAHPAKFDARRLAAFSKKTLQHADASRIISLIRERFVAAYGRWEAAEGTSHDPESWFDCLVNAAQEEACCLSDMVSLAAFALAETTPELTHEAAEALRQPAAECVLRRLSGQLTQEMAATPEVARDSLTGLRRFYREEQGWRGRDVMFPIRAALTGSLRGPCLGIVVSLLGHGRCQHRLAEALESL